MNRAWSRIPQFHRAWWRSCPLVRRSIPGGASALDRALEARAQVLLRRVDVMPLADALQAWSSALRFVPVAKSMANFMAFADDTPRAAAAVLLGLGAKMSAPDFDKTRALWAAVSGTPMGSTTTMLKTWDLAVFAK